MTGILRRISYPELRLFIQHHKLFQQDWAGFWDFANKRKLILLRQYFQYAE